MLARIFRNLKSSTQSGKAGTKLWVLEFIQKKNARSIDTIIGWTGSSDMLQELKLHFKSQKEAEDYAKAHNIEYEIINPKEQKTRIQSYSDNFM